MNKQIEALKMAIEAVEFQAFGKYRQEVVAKLKEALAEAAKQEPVAWMNDKTPSGIFARHKEGANNFGCDIPLYTNPATWQSLSDDEITKAICLRGTDDSDWNAVAIDYTIDYLKEDIVAIARAIEQALKEKNHA